MAKLHIFCNSKYMDRLVKNIRQSVIIKKLQKNTPIRYFSIGIINTTFGYLIGLVLYFKLIQSLRLPIILIIANIISISFSFITYKKFVFKTKGNWVVEYFRCYLVYGLSTIVSIFLTVAMVNIFSIQFWIAQAISIFASIAVTFVLHKNYTYKI